MFLMFIFIVRKSIVQRLIHTLLIIIVIVIRGLFWNPVNELEAKLLDGDKFLGVEVRRVTIESIKPK